jgi:hypothetical protein
MNGRGSYRIGDLVRVTNCVGRCALPAGLPNGAEVRVVGIVQTDRLVEWEGELFEVNMVSIVSLDRCNGAPEAA